MTKDQLLQEFEKQLVNLLKKKYPEAAGKTKEEFIKIVEPLKEKLDQATNFSIDLENGYLPFVIVIKNSLVPTEAAMSSVEKSGKQGIIKLYPHTSDDFQTIEEETIPDSEAYLLVNIDRGRESINIPPVEGMKLIRNAHRHPLTIDEGIAVVTHYPEFLIKNNCFSLLASRHPGDKRVPAIWINAQKHPNLGWCWDGNPHTWLGSASCETRLGSSTSSSH